ncbi:MULTISPECIES: isoprenyl transferase [Mucilaginibacter]|jgi:undecaprenyl diphosphate synthase|uniref:Isoprenyl transferase n=1 Tax=Mucilaginibacter gossypii TaxID=551996 RepID=A0A1G8GMQ5_9SPHI|nr:MULTISPECIES: isoprenyl transferase [Mucilaginibacter]NVM62036.1 undecaprenyl diphosphate synthase [Mucilaginibacter sp. SG538B]WEA03401.1 isoprenyl transferase [Mucilaginibacter sp. SJ]SCW74992.1 undecaprenyl diphosphate synthase [Mucilaginibacter sp. NFR10]SDH95684.1 undecaprenyl diphosphate synthase [Mucilaginibacter gossypii]GGB05135.1 isoprenyl transferase [Mucilaginibacter rubeus]
MDYLDQIDLSRLPQHVAIIMDGNGRWAKGKGKLRIFGHHNGVTSVRDVVEGADKLGIKYITLYTFSSENWNRPKLEVMAIMELMVTTIHKEVPGFMKNNIRLNAIGDLDTLPEKCLRELNNAIETTAGNTGVVLTLALSYSSRREIVRAAKNIAIKVKNGELNAEDINEEVFEQNLFTGDMPNPELLIRTSGEYRISNYLLWQIAYAELYFTTKLWPDFRKEDLYEAVIDFQKRERRFGLTSEQVN